MVHFYSSMLEKDMGAGTFSRIESDQLRGPCALASAA